MSEQNRAKALVEEALQTAKKADKIGAADLVIWGGTFSEEQLDKFLDLWENVLRGEAMPWRMVEYVSRFAVQRATEADAARPTSSFDLERARLFGPAGDLDLRRDGDRFGWRFLGDNEPETWPQLNQSAFPYHDFWQESEGSPEMYRVDHDYYQWRLQDQRVSNEWSAGTRLSAENVYLKQRHYIDSGRIAFVRYLDFTETKNG